MRGINKVYICGTLLRAAEVVRSPKRPDVEFIKFKLAVRDRYWSNRTGVGEERGERKETETHIWVYLKRWQNGVRFNGVLRLLQRAGSWVLVEGEIGCLAKNEIINGKQKMCFGYFSFIRARYVSVLGHSRDASRYFKSDLDFGPHNKPDSDCRPQDAMPKPPPPKKIAGFSD